MKPSSNTEKSYVHYGDLSDGRPLRSYFWGRTLAVLGVVYLVLWCIMTMILVTELMNTLIPLIVLLYVSVAIGVSIMGAIFAFGVVIIYAP